MSLTTGSSMSGPLYRSALEPPKRTSPAFSSETSGFSQSENARASSRPWSSMCQKPGRPPDALDSPGSARPCRARPTQLKAVVGGACHQGGDTAHAASTGYGELRRGDAKRRRTRMPSQEAASKSGDTSVARPKLWPGSTSGGCASVSVSLTSLPAAMPVPYFMVKGAGVPCVGRSSR